MSQADKIRSINDPGWDGVDASIEPIRLKNMDLQRDLDIQFQRCFTSEAGKKVLEHLRSITIEQPAWVPGAEPSVARCFKVPVSFLRSCNEAWVSLSLEMIGNFIGDPVHAPKDQHVQILHRNIVFCTDPGHRYMARNHNHTFYVR